MTLGDLFEEHYNYQKDKVKLTTFLIMERNSNTLIQLEILNWIRLRFKILKNGCKK